jgi:hypothetical protein
MIPKANGAKGHQDLKQKRQENPWKNKSGLPAGKIK